MKLTLFTNRTGLIHGDDPKRIGCDEEGVLKIGRTEIAVSPKNGNAIVPLLFNGCSGDYPATYTTNRSTYDLGKIAVRGGRIEPPSHTALELMDLRCRAETAEAERDELRKEVEDLKKIFDTNSLNFLLG